jgi:hypothetical protein
MAMTTKHVHLHLGELDPDVDLHIHFTRNGAGSPSEDTPEQVMLRRMKAYDNADNVQAAYDGLAGLGLAPNIPAVRKNDGKPQAYLRWTHGRPGPTKLYLNTASIAISDKATGAACAGQPGAIAKPRGETWFSIRTAAQVTQALTALKRAAAAW